MNGSIFEVRRDAAQLGTARRGSASTGEGEGAKVSSLIYGR